MGTQQFKKGEQIIQEGKPGNEMYFISRGRVNVYKIIDEDLEYIKGQGYSDEMIYEITLIGAVGAALVGLEAVYKHLYT